MRKFSATKERETGKLVNALVAFLLIALFVGLFSGLFVGSVAAHGGTFVIGSGEEAIEKIQLASPDNVVGNMSVNNGFVDFYVTDPSYDFIYQSNRTSFDSFNFTASESGTYVMHFANKYQSGDVNLTLSYGINYFVFLSTTISISTSTSVTTTQGQPYLNLVVSPMAFPVPGQSWQINVYYQTNSSGKATYYSPMPNATVEVTTIAGGQTEVYSYITDQLGQLEFQFLPKYTDISFQAVSGGNKSGTIAFTQRAQHYVSIDDVDFIYNLSILVSGISAFSVILLHFSKRIRVIFSWLMGVVFCLAMAQLVISVVVKSFWWTPWGFPNSIFGFFSLTYLKYVSVIGVVMFAILSVLAFFFRLRTPDKKVSF